MRKLFSLLALISLVMFACKEKNTAVQIDGNKMVLDCGTEIISIEDLSTEMAISLFSGVLPEEQKFEYMPEGKTPASISIFLVKTGGKTYMIDAGFGNAIKENKIDAQSISSIFITHMHGDHISGLLQNDSVVFSVPVYVAKIENDYWHSEEAQSAELQKIVASAYGKNYKTFNFSDSIVSGIIAINAAGHTPGHTAFLIGKGKQKLLIAGDFLHAAALQFPHPTESANFDMDKDKASKVRIALMEMAEKNDWFIAGMHIPSPGWGKVKSNGEGGFIFSTP
ncbi:MAG: MBL fold metallo-hydrolase [Fibromonadales bacterium]|nr:MBL fold metallo-hydrolase [Fibromonadales bacterium]